MIFSVVIFAYTLISGNQVASLSGAVGVIVVALIGVRGASMFLDAAPGRRGDKKVLRLTGLVLVSYILTICAIFVVVMAALDIDPMWSALYVGAGFTIFYLMMLQHYMWAEFRYRRDGYVLYAERPARSRYFLPTLKRRLILTNVNTVDMDQGWFSEKVLKMYRLKLTIDASMGESSSDYDSETDGMSAAQKRRHAKKKEKEAKFWRDLKYIVDGDILAQAIEEGSIMRRG
jgi:hypothetical protein